MPGVSLHTANALAVLIWFLWVPAAAVVVFRALRLRWGLPGTPRKGILLLGLLTLSLLLFATLLPMSSSAASLVLAKRPIWFFGGVCSAEHWGLPTEGLYTILSTVWEFPNAAVIFLVRSFVLLVPWVFGALALSLASHVRNDSGDETADAGPSKRMVLAVLAMAVFCYVLTFGILAGMYLAPMPIAFAVMLVAWFEEEQQKGDGWTLAALGSSVVMLALFRPETPLVLLVAVALLVWRLKGHRTELKLTLAWTLGILAFLSISGAANLLMSLRTDYIVFSEDTLADGPLLQAIPMLARRVGVGLPYSFAAQSLWTGGLLVVSIIGVVLMVRRRRVEPAAWVCAAWLILELLILSVHQEGPATQKRKYGLVLFTPVWFFAAMEFLRHHTVRRWRIGMALCGALIASVFLTTFVFHIVMRDQAVLNEKVEKVDFPALPKLLCAEDEHPHPLVFLNMTLPYERVCLPEDGSLVEKADRALSYLSLMLVRPETDIVAELLRDAGCRVKELNGSGFDVEQAHIDPTSAQSPEFHLLCRQLGSRYDAPGTRGLRAARTVVLAAMDDRWLQRTERFLGSPGNCGWRLTVRIPFLLVLER